ncbi:MAG: hypothetical protein RLY86_2041 [Pseudomonadota bacterium]
MTSRPARSPAPKPGLKGDDPLPPPRLQRVDGAMRLSYRADGDGTTRLDDLYQRAPARLLFPRGEAGEPPQAVLLTTSGGLTGGDRFRADFTVGAGAAATLTTQAAERIYRARTAEGDAVVDVSVGVGTGAWAEYLAQETILFDGARLRRGFHADIAPGGRLLALESIVLGRTARGEVVRTGLIHDAWRIRRGGRLVWADALRLDSGNGLDIQAALAAPFGFGDAVACATLLLVDDGAGAHLDPVRALLADHGRVRGGATTFDGMLIIRLLAAAATDLRAAAMATASLLRHRAGGLPQRLPQVWHC